MKMEERERACLELLSKLPAERFILIGGYATSSYDFPRFSVDLDIVIKRGNLRAFKRIIEAEGFREAESGEVDEIYGGGFVRFEKRVNGLPVSVDLLVGSVQSRQTGSSYSYDYLARFSQERNVRGVGSATVVRCKVPKPEMLIALKANSMRLADQRDIIALCNQDVDAGQVARHLKRCPRDRILENLEMLKSLLSGAGQKDSVKGVYGISNRVYDRITRRAGKVVETVTSELK